MIKYDEKAFEDIGWNKSGNTWMAYKQGDNGSFKQTGEGLRGETNPTIKQLFLYNTYFRYDGTADVAEAINKLRSENNIELGALDNRYDLSESNDILKNTTTKITTSKGDEKEYSIAGLFCKVRSPRRLSFYCRHLILSLQR